ncbi:MAG: Crp/Fnr family transcriptional regulator [Marinilabiliaceae bacterium]|jgi:CRP/FNR family transcriptional regulator|nr:Crp/Fnr family transcriptional regulator [Marinilabiliaceae bacterium]
MVKGNICNCVDCVEGWRNFKTLTKEQLAFVNENRFEALFKPGENIFKQGSPTSNAVFLSAGLAKVYMEGQGRKDFILSISGPGEMVIGPGLYTDSRHIFSMTAINDARCCFIDAGIIKQLVRDNKDFAEALITDISYKAQRNIYKLLSMTQKKMPGRVAEVLLYLADRVFKKDKFTMILTRQELADMAAMAKESVVRILKEFSDEGIISTGCPEFEIHDKKKLIMICENG